jgi:hypothetical protein
MARSYKTYTPTGYPSGQKDYDIFVIDIKDVLAKSGNAGQYRFSNPFLPIGCYTANNDFSLFKFVSMRTFYNSFFEVIASPSGLASRIQSGILMQQSQEIGANLYDYFPQEPVKSNSHYASLILDIAPKVRDDMRIFENDLTPFRAGLDGFSIDVKNLLANFHDMGALMIPANSIIQINETADNIVNVVLLVQRGNNQPFFNFVP